jgi:type IV secretion system protein VirD4
MIWDGSALGFYRDGRPISYNAGDDGSGNAPTLVLGPQGTSKTVLTCNELLDEPGRRSYIIFDPKGEICAVTSAYRRRVSDVKIINPYGLLVGERPDLRSDQWNPLGDLDPEDDLTFGDESQAKAAALITANANDANSFFTDAARSAATLAVMWEVREARAGGSLPPSLPNVRATLTLPADALRPIIERMVDCGDFDISSRAAKFLAENREIGAIKSTVEKDTAWLTRPMRDDMATASGVDFRDCARRPTTIYVIIPAREQKAKASYIRLIFTSALRALYQHGGVPATLIIEEAFILGYHAEVEQALSVLRGYGSRLTILFQSYTQIKKLYSETHGLFTAGTLLSFRPADLETGEMLMKKAGKITRATLSAGDPSASTNFQVRPSWNQQMRDRIPLAQMMAMPRNRALVWKPGDEAPRMSWVKGYFELPELAARASENPYHRSGQNTGAGPRQAAPQPLPRPSAPARGWRQDFSAGRQRVRDALNRR